MFLYSNISTNAIYCISFKRYIQQLSLKVPYNEIGAYLTKLHSFVYIYIQT